MKNVNDLGYGHCPLCKKWKELTRYHPKEAHVLRRNKNKYCNLCITAVTDSRVPFYRIKKAISNHKVQSKEGDYVFNDLMKLHKLQGGMCAYCSKSIPYEFSLDHIIPKKFGGRNLLCNMILTCNSCNSAKQHFEPFYFIRRKGYKLSERNIQRIKGAYDYHGYECSGTCKDCKGKERQNNRLCKECNIPKSTSQGAVCNTEKSTGSQAYSSC